MALSGIVPGQIPLVIGAGAIGLSAVAALSARGIDPIIIADFNDERLELAERFGAHITVNPSTRSPYRRLGRRCGRAWRDRATGHLRVRRSRGAAAADRRRVPMGSQIYAAGGWYTGDALNVTQATKKLLMIQFGGAPGADDWYGTLDAIISGRLDPLPSVGAAIGLDEVPDAIDRARKAQGPATHHRAPERLAPRHHAAVPWRGCRYALMAVSAAQGHWMPSKRLHRTGRVVQVDRVGGDLVEGVEREIDGGLDVETAGPDAPHRQLPRAGSDVRRCAARRDARSPNPEARTRRARRAGRPGAPRRSAVVRCARRGRRRRRAHWSCRGGCPCRGCRRALAATRSRRRRSARRVKRTRPRKNSDVAIASRRFSRFAISTASSSSASARSRSTGSSASGHALEPPLAKHDAPSPLGIVADFVGEAEGLVGAGREQRGVGQAVALVVRSQVVVTDRTGGRDGKLGVLDRPFGVAAEGHEVGGERGQGLHGSGDPGERGVFRGLFGVLGDTHEADVGFHPGEQRVHVAEAEVVVAERVDRRFEPGDDLEGMAPPEPELSELPDRRRRRYRPGRGRGTSRASSAGSRCRPRAGRGRRVRPAP